MAGIQNNTNFLVKTIQYHNYGHLPIATVHYINNAIGLIELAIIANT